MLTILRQSAVVLAAAGLAAGASSAAAVVLYDNGALNGTLGNFTIGGVGGTDGVSDSFVLGAESTVTGVDFGVWTFPGDTVSTVDWGITTTANSYGGFLFGGTASVVNGSTHVSSLGWPIGVDSISTGHIRLSAGITYYLVLQNAVVANGDPVYWDETDGPSAAWSSFLGSLQNINHPHSTGSESFQILGFTGVGTPEPGSWSLMLLGVAGLGAVLRGARARRSRLAARV